MSSPHSPPPAMPANTVRGIISQLGAVTLCTSQVVASAPATIWPSTPMFHRPAAKVTNMPAAQSSSGTMATLISASLRGLSNAPASRLP